MARSVDILIQGRDHASDKFGAVEGSMQRFAATATATGAAVGASFNQIVLAAALVAASVKQIVDFAGWGIQLAAEAETSRVAFETMLGSAEKASQLVSDIQAFAASTPFETGELTDATRKLVAFGISLEETIPTLRVIGDISAGIGAPIAEIAELYGKAAVQGRLFAQDINQLTGRGIPIIQELAKQFGVAESEVRGLVESGQVNFGHLQNAFIALTGDGGKFFDLMAKQSQTLAGTFSTLKDDTAALSRAVGELLVDELGLVSVIKEMSSVVQDARIGLMGMAIGFKQMGAAALQFVPFSGRAVAELRSEIVALGFEMAAIMKPKEGPGDLKPVETGAGSGPSELETSTDKLIEKLLAESDAIHYTATQIAIMKLEEQGLAGETLQYIRFLEKQNAAEKARLKGLEEADKATQKHAAAIKKSVADMETEIAIFEFSARQKEIAKLALEGLTDAELEHLMALDEKLTALEEEKKAYEALEEAAKRVFEETRTPDEKFRAKIEELKTLFAEELIDQDAFDRAVEKARLELVGDKKDKADSVPGLQATESRFLTRGRSGDLAKEQLNLAKRQVAQGEKQGRILNDMLRLTRQLVDGRGRKDQVIIREW